MKLTQIKLAGFKSFVDSTVIDIRGKLVGIVGPNGCGKSNVIDAVRWVLGESSAKQLRGDTMQDVIFNGSNIRRQISRATVELIFENREKILHGMWANYDEISIKRLISRNGESIYYINNQAVRRRDVTDLFLGTGIGTKGYAVIEQGMISQVIEASPLDLRFYLEEAAGVSKYRDRRKETVAKMLDTKENLVRIEDILSEINKQIESLTIQAAAATKYQQLNDELKTYKVALVVIKIDVAKIALEEINLTIINFEVERTNLEVKIKQSESYLRESTKLKIEETEGLNTLTNEFNILRTNITRLEEKIKHRLNLKERLLSDKNKLLIEKENLISQIDESILLVDRTNSSYISTIEKIKLNETCLDEMHLKYEDIETEYLKISKIVFDFDNEIKTKKHEAELFKNSYEHKKQQLNGLHNRRKRLEQETPHNILEFSQKYHDMKAQVLALIEDLQHIDVEIVGAREVKNKVSTLINEHTLQLNALKLNISALTSKMATINELLQKQIVNVNKLDSYVGSKTTLDPLWQNIVVSTGYELAVQVVIGYLLSATYIKDFNSIVKIPPHLWAVWGSDTNLSRSNKSPVIESNKQTEYNTLDKFVTIESGVGFQGIYNLLSQYVVCDDYMAARVLLEKKLNIDRIVTKDGHIVTYNYIIFNANASQTRVLEYQNNLKLLQSELTLFQIEYTKLDEQLKYNQLELEKYEQTIGTLEKLNNENLNRKHVLQLELARQEQIYIQNKDQAVRVKQELELLIKEIDQVEIEIDEVLGKLDICNVNMSDLRVNYELERLIKIEKETAYNLIKTKSDMLDNEIKQLVTDNQLLKHKEINLKAMITDKTKQLEQIELKIIDLDTEITSVVENDNNKELESLKGEINHVTKSIFDKNSDIDKTNRELLKLNNDLGEFRKQKELHFKRTSELELKAQEQELLIKIHNTELQELGVVSANNDVPHLKQKTVSELQAAINHLQIQIDALDLVNLKAVSDLNLTQGKYEELQLQINDLNEAMDLLETAIKQIDKETRNLLGVTYENVCQVFDVYFKTLFGGGSAKLELVDKDILSSGLQIFVSPPGKKNSSINLLSGGEKTLTAMSLVFAFFNLNPAPFCLLDEVDAPLDDANTIRFCNLVRELSGRTQFVYISHNRLTMEMAEQLIGVTMQEKGVSTTVSVSLVDAVKYIDVV